MDKKEFLTQLEPIRDLAKWLKILVEGWSLDDKILDIVIDAVQLAINTAKSDLTKKKLQKWLDFLQKMKQMEEESRLQDEKDLAELEKILECF